MRIKVQVMIESEQGEVEVIQDVAQLERAALQPETLGLSLAEAKGLLQRVQQTLVEQQIAKYHQQQSTCQDCGQRRRRKGDGVWPRLWTKLSHLLKAIYVEPFNFQSLLFETQQRTQTHHNSVLVGCIHIQAIASKPVDVMPLRTQCGHSFGSTLCSSWTS